MKPTYRVLDQIADELVKVETAVKMAGEANKRARDLAAPIEPGNYLCSYGLLMLDEGALELVKISRPADGKHAITELGK